MAKLSHNLQPATRDRNGCIGEHNGITYRVSREPNGKTWMAHFNGRVAGGYRSIDGALWSIEVALKGGARA